MLPHPQENPWLRRTKWLTQALIISGTLNIGLIATFAYFVLSERQDALSLQLTTPKESPKEAIATNLQLFRSYSLLPYQELLLRLENKDLVEEGLTKRDLALACLVAFHHFNLDKALGGIPLQKRTLSLFNPESQEKIDLFVFPGLADYQFQAIAQYAKTEKWPFTSQGIFYELKRSTGFKDPSLLDTFYLTSEYHAVYTLFSKTGLNLSREQIVNFLCQGEWKILCDFAEKQRMAMDLTPESRRSLLLSYLDNHSSLAAQYLLETDFEFILKRFDDTQILALFDLCTEKTLPLEKLAKTLLASPRTDAVWKQAASFLYAAQNEPLPEPYNHSAALQRFFPQTTAPIIPIKAPIPSPSAAKKKTHTIEPGDNLWKIARKYRVTVEDLMRANHMETEKLRPGKQLEIPEKSDKR